MKLFIDKLKNHIYWLKISSGLYDGMPNYSPCSRQMSIRKPVPVP